MGTWILPKTLDQAQQFAELMQQPLLAHEATSKLCGLFGDDLLFDAIAWTNQLGATTDARPLVKYAFYQVLSEDRVVEPWPEDVLDLLQTALDF